MACTPMSSSPSNHVSVAVGDLQRSLPTSISKLSCSHPFLVNYHLPRMDCSKKCSREQKNPNLYAFMFIDQYALSNRQYEGKMNYKRSCTYHFITKPNNRKKKTPKKLVKNIRKLRLREHRLYFFFLIWVSF